jgi:hypothetical protein
MHRYYFSKFVGEKRVFNEIEFYLPQLAHLIIHLEVDWKEQSLERFVVVLSQSSVHTALQLCFVLIAAMEDYEPENANGKVNVNSNLGYFLRCSRLLNNIERAVVFGSLTLTAEEEGILSAQVTPAQLTELKDFEKNERANQIIHVNNKTLIASTTTTESSNIDTNTPKGFLLYKRGQKQSIFISKGWKSRYFKIDQRILLCYKGLNSKVPVRSIHLEDCDLFTVKRQKYEFQFELKSRSSGVKFQLRATDQVDFDKWVQALRREASRPPESIPPSESVTPNQSVTTKGSSSSDSTDKASPMPSEGDSPNPPQINSQSFLLQKDRQMQTSVMTDGQKKRFRYFQQQRAFVTKLTAICEDLR